MTRSISISLCLGLFVAVQATVSAQTITNQPQSITVNNASDAEFAVGASGATSFQWKFNGGNLSDATNISGSSTATLTLEDVNSNQMGNYSVEINGSVTSSNATLTVTNGTIVTFVFTGFVAGGTSNVDVQLFDHDKPATVENFLHYITSGAFSNMFYHRDGGLGVQVLQAGAFGASNRTSTTAPITAWNIPNIQPSQPFPKEVDNEFGIGPVIHNRFGTIAMALSSGETNSATSGFFFNLADNTSSLDPQDFTVFGRILNGSNTLNYFSAVTDDIVTDAQILANGTLVTNTFPMPVNYVGNVAPGNANLVFADFLYTNTPVDTTPPTVAITSPAPNALVTNAEPILVRGTASDDVAVANVLCSLTPQAALDGTLPNGGVGFTNFAIGGTNWEVGFETDILGLFFEPVPVGVYQLSVQSQDGAGNLSTAAVQPLTNTAIVVLGNGTVSFTAGAGASNNPVGYPLQSGSNYSILAAPGSGETFVSWSSADYTTTNLQISFDYPANIYTATFISNQVAGIAITSPANDPTLSNTLFNISGTIDTGILTPPVTVTVQIFTNTVSNFAVTSPQSTVGTNTWTIGETDYLPSGSYFIQAVATDSLSNQTLVTTNFTYIADTTPPTISITSPAPNALLFDTNTLAIQGTAGSDGIVPVVSVKISMIPVAGIGGVVPGGSFTDVAAVGTSNWSFSLTNGFGSFIPPGQFQLVAEAVTGPGVVTTQTNTVTISGIQIIGNGTVMFTVGTNTITNSVGYPLQQDGGYPLKAVAGPGYTFANFSYRDIIVADSVWNNFAYSGGLLTANFVLTNPPRGTKGIAFTYPHANQKLTTNSFVMKGTIAHVFGPAHVTTQVFSLTSGAPAGPPQTVSGTTTWSVPVSNLPPDIYGIIATATNGTGLSTLIEEAFYVLEFKGVAGTYDGLFLCDTGPIAPTNSGFFSFTVAASGAYSGRLLFPAYRPVVIDNVFGPNGNGGEFTVGLPSNAIYLTLNLAVTNGTDELTGIVGAQSGSWSSPLICYRGVTKLTTHTTPATGRYVLGLDPTDWGNTNGYASLTAAGSGAMTLTGALPDGATFSQAVKVSSNGIWPVYVVPTGYKTNGMLIGWETNQPSGAVSGQLFWHKAANVGTYFTSGVETTVNPAGTNYIAPAAGSYTIVFQGGSLATPVTNNLTVTRAGGPFRVTPADPADKLSISLSATGVITGRFLPETGARPLQFKGIFLGQTEGGSGFVLDSGNQTGYFVLEAQ